MIKPLTVEPFEQLNIERYQHDSINKSQPTIALLHCYDLIDDFLDSINISFEDYCQEFIGSWTFGYVNALKEVGVRKLYYFAFQLLLINQLVLFINPLAPRCAYYLLLGFTMLIVLCDVNR